MEPIVIIGSGLAGYTLAKEIRKRDTQLPMHLICADNGASYSKPMLSNALAKGKTASTLIMANSAEMAEQLDITIWNHTQAISLTPGDHTITTNRGDLAYSKLVLALGADPIRIPMEGDAVDKVLSINDLHDYKRFREVLDDKHRVTIMGAGLIGCEFANDLQANGVQVSIVDPADRPLGRLLPEQAAAALRNALTDLGATWHLGTTVTHMEHDGNDIAKGYLLTLADGKQINTDLVLSAISLRSRTQLANDAGIGTNRGICVDRTLETDKADIYALGDCAEVDGLVLPFIMPLMQAARALAATLTGEATNVLYPAMPVVVKTPCMPVVVSPPAPDQQGTWHEEMTADGVLARFKDANENLLGFALTGDAVAEKMRLAKELPPMLA